MSDGTVRTAFVEELCDVLMYFTDLMTCYGVSTAELSNAFIAKHEKNMQRDFVTEHENYLSTENP